MPSNKTLTALVTILALVPGFLTTTTPAFGASSFKILYSFQNSGTDGNTPVGSLIFDANGNLYGTTSLGGDRSCTLGCGTVFELTPGAKGKWSEEVLYSFQNNGADGFEPVSELIFDAQGNLYGTTLGGGAYGNYGAVFELMPGTGGSWTETVLHSFNLHMDGFNPYAGLIFDAAGNLFGTTAGTVFELTPGAGGTWTESVLYTFGTNSHDGGQPRASLLFDPAGNLYSTVSHAGIRGGKAVGLIFQLTPGSNGTWTEKMLYGCKIQGCPNQGIGAHGSVIFDAQGNLYSTTFSGGAYGYGTVFELTPHPDGKWTEKVLHSFGKGNDGSGPLAGLVFDAAGHLYGTTQYGGTGAGRGGTVFRLTHGANGKWTEEVVHNFGGSGGANLQGDVIFDAAGNLYGTTSQGGAHNSGTVFEITP